jgi:hypothetical protein
MPYLSISRKSLQKDKRPPTSLIADGFAFVAKRENNEAQSGGVFIFVTPCKARGLKKNNQQLTGAWNNRQKDA